LQYVAGLRERAFAGVDEEDNAIDHAQSALDFATEVAVTGGVDDIDFGVVEKSAVFLARMVMPRSRSRSLESMTRSTTASLARKMPELPEHGVDEGGFAVVDVGDDGDVANVLAHGAKTKIAAECDQQPVRKIPFFSFDRAIYSVTDVRNCGYRERFDLRRTSIRGLGLRCGELGLFSQVDNFGADRQFETASGQAGRG